jgi:ACR3 family arsenite efflux pump ArsB
LVLLIIIIIIIKTLKIVQRGSLVLVVAGPHHIDLCLRFPRVKFCNLELRFHAKIQYPKFQTTTATSLDQIMN